jgi:hypothetical protein
MAATTSQLVALSQDQAFIRRARAIILEVCAAVYLEDPQTPNHGARVSFANKLIQQPGLADGLVSLLVTRVNLVASNVTYSFDTGQILTDASDAAILAQVTSDWNMFAGV